MSQDANLQQAVLAELKWEPSVAAGHIGVSARDGVITLSGHVEIYAEKIAAETASRRVKNVKAVVEEIEVRPAFDAMRHDDDIAAAAIKSIEGDVMIPRGSVKVKVESGRVTLTGQVDSYFQKEAAELDVRRLYGVVDLSNEIAIKPRVDIANISDDIIHALHRSWFFDPKTIRVSAVGGKVTLSGTVNTPHDRQVAAMTAWAAPGVTDVQNNIAIAQSVS